MERTRVLALRILVFSGYTFLAIILLPAIIVCILDMLSGQIDDPSPPSPRSMRRKEERTRRLAGKARWQIGRAHV